MPVAMTTKLADIRLNGVAVDQPFEWDFIRGGRPFVYRYKCKYGFAEEIISKAVKKRISAGGSGQMPSVDISYKGYVNYKEYKFEIKNLVVLNKDLDNIIDSTLILADIRYFFSFATIRGYYNMVRKINSYTIAKGINVAQDATEVEKLFMQGEFADRYRLNRYAYQEFSINGTQPWKSVELLDKFLSKYFGKYWGGFAKVSNGKLIKTKPDWSDVAPENKVYNGTNATTAIDELLKNSRSAGYVMPDGKFYVMDCAEDDVFQVMPVGYESLLLSPNKIHQKDNTNIRPVSYEVGSEPEYEFPLIYHFSGGKEIKYDDKFYKRIKDESEKKIEKGIRKLKKLKGLLGGFGVPTPDIPTGVFTPSKGGGKNSKSKVNINGNLLNVLKLPFAITVKGEKYEAETWISITELLDYFGFDWNYILSFWFNSKWSILFSKNYQRVMSANDPNFPFSNSPPLAIREYDNQFKMLVQAISQNYWRTFMIKEELRDKMIRWTPQRSAIAQRRTGHRIHSPVWCNYIDYESVRTFLKKGKSGNWERMAKNYNIEYNGMKLNAILQDDPSPFPLRMVDADAGVFSIDFSADKRGHHYNFEPGCHDPSKIPFGSPAHDMANITQIKKLKEFKLVVLVSVVWGNPVDDGAIGNESMYSLGMSGTLKGNAPVKKIFCNKELARFAWRKKFSDAKQIVQSKPINQSVLELYAASMVNEEEFQLQDWYVGTMEILGCYKNVFPFGNCEITVKLGDKPSTIFKQTVPERPTWYQEANYRDRRFLTGEGEVSLT